MSHLSQIAYPATAGFPVSLLFPDVPPDVLEREDAYERRHAMTAPGSPWHSYLRRVLPALERQSADDMAGALLAAGHHPVLARSHAVSMRQQAVAAGDIARVTFWGQVNDALMAQAA